LIESGEGYYRKSPTKNMVFDCKIMSMKLPERKMGLQLGVGKKTYSYIKIKR
jgi:hypothetical protein